MAKRSRVQKANFGEMAANAARAAARLSESGGIAGRIGRGLSRVDQAVRGLGRGVMGIGEGVRSVGRRVRNSVANANPFGGGVTPTSASQGVTRTPAQYVGTPEEYLRRNPYDMQANGIGERFGQGMANTNPFGDDALTASFLQGLMGTPEEYLRRNALPQNPNPYAYGNFGSTFPSEKRKAGTPRFSRAERKANQYRGFGMREDAYYPEMIAGQDPLTFMMAGDAQLISRPRSSVYSEGRNARADLEYNDGKSPYKDIEYPDDPNYPWSQAYRDRLYPPDAAVPTVGGLNPNWMNVGVPAAPKPVNRRPTAPSGRGYRGINRITDNIRNNPSMGDSYSYANITEDAQNAMNAYEQRKLALPENRDAAFYQNYLNKEIARIKQEYPHYSDILALGKALRERTIDATQIYSPEQLKAIALQFSKEIYTDKSNSFHERNIESLFPQYKNAFYSAKPPQVVEPLVIKPRGKKGGLNPNWADLNGGLGKSMGKRDTINKFMDNSFAKSMSKPTSNNRSIKSSNKYFN